MKRHTPLIFLFIIFSYFLILLKPVILGELDGTFKNNSVPEDYIKLERFLSSGEDFYRTLWILDLQRFGFHSNRNPAISASLLFKSSNLPEILDKVGAEEAQELLEDLAVKYVIVPYDSEGEIFLTDRKYDETKYRNTTSELRGISWLRELSGFGKVAVFETENSKDHFWSPSSDLRINYSFINPTEYSVRVKNARKRDVLVFSEGFDKNWTAGNSKFKIQSSPRKLSEQSEIRLNSFTLPESGNYELKVYYEPQKYVEAGLWVSGFTLLASVGYLLFGKKLKKW